MFKKCNKNLKRNTLIREEDISQETEIILKPELELKEDEKFNGNSNQIDNLIPENQNFEIQKIKLEIDKKNKKQKRTHAVKEKREEETIIIPMKKEEPQRESTIKKIFLPESVLQKANAEEMQKLLGIKREEVERLREEKRKGLVQMQKELFSLPKDLSVQPSTKNDHVENLLRLSAAGLIEVPLPLEQKLKNIEETEVMKKHIIDNKLEEELDYLKVLKKLGPSYAKGYKSDISSKKLAKLNNVFENVFVNQNGRIRKLLKEKTIMENRKLEGDY